MPLKIQNMMEINVELLQWLKKKLSLDKKLQVEQLKMKIFPIKNYLKNYTNQLLKKNQEKKSTLNFYRRYFGYWSCWYAINKQI